VEALEHRELLSSFTWNGNAGDGNWDDGANWAGGVPPTSGTADIVFSNPSSPQTITLHAEDAGLVFESITVQGGSYTLQGPTKNASQELILAAGASLDTQNGSSLAICPDRLSSPDANSLSLNLLGSTTKIGTGTLLLANDLFLYAVPAGTLEPFHISAGTVTLGADTSMDQSLLQVDTGTRLVVSENFIVTVGSLSGSGTAQIGVNPGQTDTTQLNIFTPQGESDVFSGVINGQGGSIVKIGTGSITLGSVNPVGSGLFNVSVSSGTLLVNGALNAQKLLVVSGATFGGLGTMDFSNLVQFGSGATFAAVANGTAAGQFTRLTDTDAIDTNSVNLGSSTLSLSLGYAPAQGDSLPLISAAKGITGRFANASNGQTFTVSGVPFQVNASATAFTLALPRPTAATQLFVLFQPSVPVVMGNTFKVVVAVLTSSGSLATSYSGPATLTLAPLATNPPGASLGGTTTVNASGGVASFSDLTLNLPGSYVLVGSATGLSSASTAAITVNSQPPPPAVLHVLLEKPLIHQNTNKRGKPVGRPVLIGYQFTFDQALNSATAGISGNYQVGAFVPKRVRQGRRTVPVNVLQQIPFSVSVSGDVVQVLTGKQTFKRGGQITLTTDIGDLEGGFLASPLTFNIAAGGKGID
jgi:hypothetical protein